MTAVLDELERLLREATAGRYSSETRNDETIVSADDGLGDGGFGVAAVSRVVDARLLVAMRNNFDALLAVARAVNNAGQKVLCDEGGALGLIGGRTIAAFDIKEKVSGVNAVHDYTEVGPLGGCEPYHLKNVSDWTLSVVSSYPSQVTPHTFADKVRLQAPSRGVDLTLTAVVQGSETYLVEPFFPGAWEGPMTVTGWVDGKRVWGDAFMEQFNQQ